MYICLQILADTYQTWCVCICTFKYMYTHTHTYTHTHAHTHQRSEIQRTVFQDSQRRIPQPKL